MSLVASTPVVPTRIDTERLVLRQFAQEDWPALHEHYADVECTRFTFRRALSEGESWRAMASMVGHWSLRGYGPYALAEKTTGTVVGAAGLWYPNDWPGPEIKWALARKYWHRGLANEAVRAIQSMAAKNIPQMSLISFIDAENTASIRLALAVGAHRERDVQFRGGPWHIYRHPTRLP